MSRKAGSHEAYVEFKHVEPPSDRKFGLTVGAIFIAIAIVRWLLGSPQTVSIVFASIGVALIVPALLFPALLRPLNRGWMKLGMIMAGIINPVVMLLMFLLIFLPIGLLRRAFGSDPLQLRRKEAGASYWVERSPPGPAPDTMINQF